MCVSPAEAKKKHPGGPEKDVSGFEKRSGVRYKMFRGRGKDCSKSCIEVEKKDCALFLGLIAGLKKKLEVEKKTCRGRKQDGPIARSRKRHFGVEKKSSPQISTELRK